MDSLGTLAAAKRIGAGDKFLHMLTPQNSHPFNASPGEAVYMSTVCGHNSAVVNNKGIPEQTLYSWDSDSISVMTLSDQTNSLRFAAGGDLRQTNDKCAGQNGRILSDDEVRRVAAAAKKIHDHFGTGAQDIEWGMIGERLYIFQARPYLDAVKPFEQAAGN